jgi:hypothetical protein
LKIRASLPGSFEAELFNFNLLINWKYPGRCSRTAVRALSGAVAKRDGP